MAHAVNDRLIDLPETVSVLGVSPRTVHRLAEQGILTRVKVLGATRYRWSEVQGVVRDGTPRRRNGHAAAEAQAEALCAPDGQCDELPVAKARAAGPGSGEPGPENPRGAYPGPGDFASPGGITPEQFDRGYLDADHAAPSPMHRPPNTNPLPAENRGILTPLQVHATPAVSGTGPVVRALAAHQARAKTLVPPRGQ